MKVGRPKMAIAGAVMVIVSALLFTLVLSLGLFAMSQEGELSEIDFEGVFYAYIWCGLAIAGGILMLLRKYKFGGVFALSASVLLAIFAWDIWYISILGITGGIFGIISREKVPARIMEVAQRYGRVNIREVAAETGKTEADVELAISELQSKGQPIRFDKEAREVIYG